MADGYEGSIFYANVFWVRTKPDGEWISVLALKGDQGTPGRNGNDGKVYVPTFDGRYLTWELRSRPPSGETFSMDLRGPIGEPGPAGPVGPTGPRGPQGERGDRGESALDQAMQAGYEGTARAFYDALAAVVATGEKAQEAIDLAKKNNHAHLFETRAEFDLWIADPQMTNTLIVGDYLFIKETGEYYMWDGDSAVSLPSPVMFEEHVNDHDNPHRVTAAQVGALTETAANTLYPRFRDEDATTTVGNNHGRNVMASQNGENGGFYVTGVAGNPPSRKQWLTEYQRNRVRVYTETSGESKDYYWDEASSGDAERVILRWCDLFAQAVTTVWRGIMRMCNPRIAAYADDASKDIAIVPNANGAGLQLQFPGGSTAMIRMKTGTLATTAEVKDGDASTLASAKAYADGKVAGAYRYKGTVASKEALPASGNVEGDVWNVSEDGMNYAWTGTAWDALGATVDLSAYSTTAQADERYLQLTGGTVTGNVTFNGADNYMTALRFGGTAEAAGLKTRGICGWNVMNQKNGLFLNYDGREVPTEEYFSAGEKRGVYICGGNDTTNQTCLVLRKMDGDTFYAPKGQTYTKTEVDQKITSALGDISAALAQI